MAYNSYYTNIVARLLFLLLTFIGLAYLLVNTSRFFSMVFLFLLVVIQILSLVYFLNRTNRNLARFLLLLTEEDTSVIAWKDRVEKTFQGLHHSFKKVNEEISRIRMEKEEGSILLQHVIDHVNTGIFAIDEDGNVEIVNAEALNIFGLNQLDRMDELNDIHDGCANNFMKLRYDTGNIIHLTVGGETIPVLVHVSVFKLGDKHLRLFSLQGIKNELEANEIESWQKMTRVLAHEISNSVTPISTLGAGINRKLSQASRDKSGGLEINSGAAIDLLQSSEVIEKRSNALVEFMEHYKNFARLPDPVPEAFTVAGFYGDLKLFFDDDLNQNEICLDLQITDPELTIRADRSLLEQAFINLIRNSVEALEDRRDGMITLKSSLQKDQVSLEVSDNGSGIPADIQPQVFIPFFTTKSGGTGIGMSIVRKIVNMSGGSVLFQSKEDEGTTFIIRLPQNVAG